MSYDSRCHDLAGVFLRDGPIDDPAVLARHQDRLAQEIQDQIEMFLEHDTQFAVDRAWAREANNRARAALGLDPT